MNIRDEMSSVIQSIPSSSPAPVTAEHATMLQCRLENFSLFSSRASAIWILALVRVCKERSDEQKSVETATEISSPRRQ